MSDFDERIKRASQKISQKSDAAEEAREGRKQARKDFLLNFWEKGSQIIEPVLERAKGHLAPQIDLIDLVGDPPQKKTKSGISASVAWSKDEDRISLAFTRKGGIHSAIVFAADSAAMLVHVSSDSVEVANDPKYLKLQALNEGTGEHRERIADLTLQQINREVIEECVAKFIEQCAQG